MDVIRVSVVEPYVLDLTFEDGSLRRINLEPELWGPMFEPLRNPALFAQVRVEKDLGTIVWPNGADLAPEFLWEHGKPIAEYVSD